jgi:hypothetical protein
MSAEEDAPANGIANENAKSIEKLRDLTKDLEMIVEHEQRIVKEPTEIKPPT